MVAPEFPSLSSLDYISYIDESGCIPEDYQAKIGVYAIFDADKCLQFVGYSRDIYLSLKQHLIRQPDKCYWFKLTTIERPSRTVLEEIRQKWLAENGTVPPGNSQAMSQWAQSIDAKLTMSEAEKQQYEQAEERAQIKLLKKIARRVEAEIEAVLKSRGVTMQFRFNPKLKEKGLLDLK